MIKNYHHKKKNIHKKYFIFYFWGKKSTIGSLYPTSKLTRIITKGGWAVISWGQRAVIICLTTSNIS